MIRLEALLATPFPPFPLKFSSTLRCVHCKLEGCELADYNLTLDGSTGAITQVPGTPVYQEPFSVECVVTAHQTSTASFEAKVRIAMDWFAYGVPMLMFLGEAF